MGKLDVKNLKFILVPLSALFLFFAVAGFKTLSLIFSGAALLPLLFLIFLSNSRKESFCLAWLAGFLFFLAQISWFLSTSPLDWAGIENPFWGYAIAGTALTISALVLGFFIGLFGLALKTFPLNQWWYAGVLLWPILEYLRSWGFGFFWLGKESLLGPYWTFGNLGYAVVNVPPLLTFSKVAGLYGSSFMIILPSFAILFLILKMEPSFKRSAAVIALTLVAVLAFGVYVRSNSDAPPAVKKVALIQTNFPQEFSYSETSFWTRAKSGMDKIISTKSRDREIQLVVLPEGSLVTEVFLAKKAWGLDELFFESEPFLLIDAARVPRNALSPEKIYYIDSQKGVISSPEKALLIPGGEYLPYSIRALASALNPDWLKKFYLERGQIKPASPAKKQDNQEVAVLACSGIIAPDLYQNLTKNGSKILVNTASHSLFRGNPLFLNQAEAMLRFIAASSDRFMIQAANGGLNYIIDNSGRIRERSPGLGSETLTGEAEYRDTRYPATHNPNWPVFLSVLILFLANSRSVLGISKLRTNPA